MMGAHRLVEKGLMYEEATRIPWLIRVPSLGRRQQVIEQPVSQIDLVPTLLELMGHSEAAANLPGQSLVPLIKGDKGRQGGLRPCFHRMEYRAENTDRRLARRMEAMPD